MKEWVPILMTAEDHWTAKMKAIVEAFDMRQLMVSCSWPDEYRHQVDVMRMEGAI